MEDDFCVETISVKLAFQRELAYRKKLELELGPDHEMLKNLVPLQEQFSIPCHIPDRPKLTTPSSLLAKRKEPPTSSSASPLSHTDLHCKEEFPVPSPVLECSKRKEPPTSSSTSPWTHSDLHCKEEFSIPCHILECAKQKEPPTSLSASSLSDSDLYCKVCNIVCSCRSNLDQHLRGHKHRSKLEELEKWQRWWCHLCGIPCTNEDTLKLHFEGKKHKLKLLESEGSSAATTLTVAVPPERRRFYCVLCRLWCIDELCYKQHLSGKRHKLSAYSSRIG